MSPRPSARNLRPTPMREARSPIDATPTSGGGNSYNTPRNDASFPRRSANAGQRAESRDEDSLMTPAAAAVSHGREKKPPSRATETDTVGDTSAGAAIPVARNTLGGTQPASEYVSGARKPGANSTTDG